MSIAIYKNKMTLCNFAYGRKKLNNRITTKEGYYESENVRHCSNPIVLGMDHGFC